MCCRLRPCVSVSQVGKALAAIALLLIVAGETPGGRKVQWWTHKRAARIQQGLRSVQSWLQSALGRGGADTKKALQESSPGGGITVSPSMRFNLTGQSMKRVAGATGDWLQTRINEALATARAPLNRGSSTPRGLRKKSSSSSSSSLVAASPKGAVLSRGASVDPLDATSPPTWDKKTMPFDGAAEAPEPALGRLTTVKFSEPACAAGAATGAAGAAGNARQRGSVARAPNLLRSRSAGAVRRTIAAAVVKKGRSADDEATLSPDEDEGEDDEEEEDESENENEEESEAEAEGVDGDDVKAGGKVDGPISLRGAAVSLTVYAALQRNVAERRKQTQERAAERRANFVSNLQRACNPMHPACSSMHSTTTLCVQARRVCREPEERLRPRSGGGGEQDLRCGARAARARGGEGCVTRYGIGHGRRGGSGGGGGGGSGGGGDGSEGSCGGEGSGGGGGWDDGTADIRKGCVGRGGGGESGGGGAGGGGGGGGGGGAGGGAGGEGGGRGGGGGGGGARGRGARRVSPRRTRGVIRLPPVWPGKSGGRAARRGGSGAGGGGGARGRGGKPLEAAGGSRVASEGGEGDTCGGGDASAYARAARAEAGRAHQGGGACGDAAVNGQLRRDGTLRRGDGAATGRA